jgi:prepilin-type N-terminal cleavage/methylation domain-containing protein
MNNRISPIRTSAAFTLIELLAVMAIIAILMAILLPTIQKSKIIAQQRAAKTTAMEIVAAVAAYQSEYGKLPSINPGMASQGQSDPTADTIVGDQALLPNAKVQADNSALFNTLRAISPSADQTNPRHIVYFEAPVAANPEHPKGGFLDNPQSGPLSSKKGCLFDPWGTEFFVVMDTNYDGQINLAGTYKDFAFPELAPRVTTGVFSLGVDLQPGSPAQGLPANTYQSGTSVSDDVISWR